MNSTEKSTAKALQNPTTKELLSFLRKVILDNYNSLSNFAIQSQFDKADLSRFLAGHSEWGIDKVVRLFQELQINFRVKC